jgi:hypothetical protein
LTPHPARGSTDQQLRARERAWRESGDPAAGLAYAHALERVGQTPQATRVRAEVVDDGGFLSAVGALPRPTPQQIANYACFVSRCHSWYKHLRLTPAEPFQFYLSPFPNDYDGAVHYAAHPPEFHVEHYGHFEYFRPRHSDRSALASLPDGSTLPIPGPLLDAGTANVTAFLHPTLSGDGGWWRRAQFYADNPKQYGLEEFEERLDREGSPAGFTARVSRVLGLRTRSERTRELWRAHATEAHTQTLANLRAAMHRVCDVVFGPTEQRPVEEGRTPWFGSHGMDTGLPGSGRLEPIPPPASPEG